MSLKTHEQITDESNASLGITVLIPSLVIYLPGNKNYLKGSIIYLYKEYLVPRKKILLYNIIKQ